VKAENSVHPEALVAMVTTTDKRFPWGVFTDWILALGAATLALIELWMGDSLDAAFWGVLAIYVAVQAATQRDPRGWWSAARWSLMTLWLALLVARIMRSAGFL
jgi:hypothetical protein